MDPCSNVRKYKTCRRENVPGHAHALTFTCFQGRPFLSRDRARHWLLQAIATAREKQRFDLWAYVIMPEHVHLLIHPREQVYSISSLLTVIKQPVTRSTLAYVREHAPGFLDHMRDEQPNGKVAHRFWQRGGGYDRNLADVRIIRATIAYLHANPVRRGLVTTPDDWVWSSARYYSGRTDGLLAPDMDSLPTMDEQTR